jgi:hypothetical protein
MSAFAKDRTSAPNDGPGGPAENSRLAVARGVQRYADKFNRKVAADAAMALLKTGTEV